MTSTEEIAGGMLAAVPFARTLGVEFVETDADGAVVARLPDNEANHNHVGGPHAGALFSLGETASGAIVLATFAEQLTRAVPLAVRAEIAYRKLALGAVLARARLGRPAAEVVAELDAGRRPEFGVEVEMSTADGKVVAEMTIAWTLRPR
jgi:acyl-coenzyme A thioesterase PaaI-like protein